MRYWDFFFYSLHPPSDPYTEQTDIIHHSRTFRPRYVEQPTLTVCFLIVCVLQILFDILPLRLVPPLMFGGIVYGLVGLVPTVPGFWKFMLTLVLFNLTTASVVLWLSIGFASVSVASLVGTLIMLFKFVFPPKSFL